jgi:ketol-acid reductoisomerase
MENYFNTLSLRNQLAQLGKCSLMDPADFNNGVAALENKKLLLLVVVLKG